LTAKKNSVKLKLSNSPSHSFLAETKSQIITSSSSLEKFKFSLCNIFHSEESLFLASSEEPFGCPFSRYQACISSFPTSSQVPSSNGFLSPLNRVSLSSEISP